MSYLDSESIKKIAKLWFTWLGWFLALGALGYMSKKHDGVGIKIVYGISYTIFFLFIQASIADLLNVKLLKNKMVNGVVTLVLSIAVLAGVYTTLNKTLESFLKN